jgi:hypothetical protein
MVGTGAIHKASFFTIIFVYNRKVKKNAFVYAINARGKRLRIKNGQSRETRNIGYTRYGKKKKKKTKKQKHPQRIKLMMSNTYPTK